MQTLQTEIECVKYAARDAIEEQGIPIRMVCPVCRGGSEKEQCMTVYVGECESIWATCHRAQCNITTVQVSSPRTTHYKLSRLKDNARGYDDRYKKLWRAAQPLSCSTVSEWYPALKNTRATRWFLAHPTDKQRFLMPMVDEQGKERGVISRVRPEYKELDVPKSLTFKDKDYNGMSWYRPYEAAMSHAVWVVEDPASAIVLSSYGVDAVSLNGTNLNEDRMMVLRDSKWVIKLALDADATRQAIRHSVRFMGSTKIEVCRLTIDVKDMTVRQVKKFLRDKVDDNEMET